MNLYVSNLDFSVKEIELEQLFSRYGDVKSVKLIIDKKTKKSKGYAFVELEEFDYDFLTKDLSGKEYRGRKIKVKQAQQK